MKRLKYITYRGRWSTFETLFQKAADFASNVGPERVVNISHSEDDDDGVVTVWYWSS